MVAARVGRRASRQLACDCSRTRFRASGGEHVAKQARAVGHDAVHAEVEQVVHRRLVVHGPDMNREARAMGGPHEAGGDDRDRPSAQRDLDAVCVLARHPAADCGHAGDGDGARSNRRAGPAAAERAEAAKTAIGEGAEARPIPGAEPVADGDERLDARVGLGIDVDEGLGPAPQQLVEPRYPDAATAEGQAAVGGPWPAEWIDLFERWTQSPTADDIGHHLVLAQPDGPYQLQPASSDKRRLRARVIAPSAGCRAWFALDSITSGQREYTLYLESPLPAKPAGEIPLQALEMFQKGDATKLLIP